MQSFYEIRKMGFFRDHCDLRAEADDLLSKDLNLPAGCKGKNTIEVGITAYYIKGRHANGTR